MLCPCSIHTERRLRNRVLQRSHRRSPSLRGLELEGGAGVSAEAARVDLVDPASLAHCNGSTAAVRPTAHGLYELPLPYEQCRAAVEIASAPFSDGLTCMCRPQTESQVRCDDCHSITGTRPSRCWSAAVMLVLVVITGIPAVPGYVAYLTQG
jgi:hypothetical protein